MPYRVLQFYKHYGALPANPRKRIAVAYFDTKPAAVKLSNHLNAWHGGQRGDRALRAQIEAYIDHPDLQAKTDSLAEHLRHLRRTDGFSDVELRLRDPNRFYYNFTYCVEKL